MKPAPFAYHAPESLEEVLALLASGDGVRVLAGGQSLVPMMKARALKPLAVIDVNRVPGLAFVEEEGGAVHIGALTRQQALLDDDVARTAQPLLHAAGRFAGYLATRHRGTVGGSLAFAAPWAELTAAVVALDAQIEVQSARGERTVTARSFFKGPHETALEADELLVAVHVPAAAPRTGAGFHEIGIFTRRSFTSNQRRWLAQSRIRSIEIARNELHRQAKIDVHASFKTRNQLYVAQRHFKIAAAFKSFCADTFLQQRHHFQSLRADFRLLDGTEKQIAAV